MARQRSGPKAPDRFAINRERLYLFDTTLRDGAQTTGVDFSLEDKRQIAALLDRLGVDYVEGGYPGANPLDTKFFEQKPTQRARFAAFGMTKRPGRSAGNDPGVAALLAAKADAIVFVAKSWDYHVRVALGVTLDENLESISSSVKAAVDAGREAMVDCEHFFDGYKANPDYALACVRAAYKSGARWIVLCDTNGGTLPDEVSNESSARRRRSRRESASAFTRTTTPRTRSPIRSPPCKPAPGKSRAPSTGLASVAATPISSR